MKGPARIIACAALLAAAMLPSGRTHAQWLEKTIYLPDSLSGVTNGTCLAWNSVNNRVYVAGEEPGFVVVVDGATNQKVARIPTGRYATAMCYNPTNNKVYCACSWITTGSGGLMIINGATNRVIDTVPQSILRPCALCYNSASNKVYCADAHSSYHRLTVVSGSGDNVVATIPLAAGRYGLCYNSANNKVYCSNSCMDSIKVISGAGNTVIASVPAGDSALALCYNPTNNRVYCANYKSGTVTVIDGAGDTVLATIPVGTNPDAFCYNRTNNKVYCASQYKLSIIDGLSNVVVDTTPASYSKHLLCYNSRSNKVYSTGDYDDSVSVIDGATNNMIARVPIGKYSTYARATCYDSTDNRVHCLSWHRNEVKVIDGVADSVVATVTVGMRAGAIAYNYASEKVYVADITSNKVSVVDAATNQVRVTVSTGQAPCALCHNSTNNRVYVAADYDTCTAVIDGVSDSVIAMIPVGDSSEGICYDPTGNKVYCSNRYGRKVTVIDGATNAVHKRVPMRWSPTSNICYNLASDKVYCGTDSLLAVINCATDSVVAWVNAGRGWRIQQVAYCPDYDKVYVSNMSDTFVAAVDGARDSVVARIHTHPSPYRFAYNSRHRKLYCQSSHPLNPWGIDVIDPDNDSLVDSVRVRADYYDICYNSAGNKLYVQTSANGDDDVTVVDGGGDTLLGRIRVGRYPRQFAVDTVHNRTYVTCEFGSCVCVIRDTMFVGCEEGRRRTSLQLDVLPNPCAGILRIRAGAAGRGQPQAIRVYDVSGRKVRSLGLSYGSDAWAKLDLRDLPDGVYFVGLSDGSSASSSTGRRQKVVLSR